MKIRTLLTAAALLLCGCGESSQGQDSGPASSEPQAVTSQQTAENGKCGKGLSWSLDERGKLIISGDGEMDTTAAGSSPWQEIKDRIKTAELSDGVSSIGAGAFAGCIHLESIEIPDSVKAIGNSAFEGCRELKTIKIPNSVSEFGEKVFWNCEKLESAVIGKGVKELGYNTFCKCRALTSVTISQGLERIGDCAFEYCTSLREITIPDTVTSMGYNVFPAGEVIIKGRAGSAAQQYADKFGHSFKAV